MIRIASALLCLAAGGCVVEAVIHGGDPGTSSGFASVSEVRAEDHPEVATILMVQWTQDLDADEAWLEVETEDGVHTTPPFEAPAGTHTQAILGAPPGAELVFRIHNTIGDEHLESEDTWTATTGTLPHYLPVPRLDDWDTLGSSEHPYMLISVDVTDDDWYDGPYYLYIVNRSAEVVWYYEVPDNRCTMFPRPSTDGTHLAFEQTTTYSHWDGGAEANFQRTTLDLGWSELVDIPYMVYTWDEDEDGNLYFDSILLEYARTMDRLTPEGVREVMWNANEGLGVSNSTSTNTVRLFPERGTFLWSMYLWSSVAEIDLATGELVHLWGDLADEWTFDPPELGFHYQHFPGFTPEGNLLVSSHPANDRYVQRTWEFEVDEEDKVLRLVWEFGEDHPDDYAVYAGEATRLDNGNTLINYGTDGLVREVTPDKEVVWQMDWDGDYVVGHSQFLDDLYALNRGR